MEKLLSFLLVASLVIVAGCADVVSPELENELSQEIDSAAAKHGGYSSSKCTTLAGYTVCLTETELEETTTTLTYTVTPRRPRHALDHLVIGFPACDPELTVLDTNPESIVVERDHRTGIGGVKFDLRQRKNETRQYHIRFAGKLPLAQVKVGIKAGNQAETSRIKGAVCEGDMEDPEGPGGTFDILGSVYVESDEPGTTLYQTREANELGIGNVVVNLVDERDDIVATTTTGDDGVYRFNNIPNGTYRVVIPNSSGCGANTNCFNGTLYATSSGRPLYLFTQGLPGSTGNINSEGLAELEINLDSHTDDVDFGFELQSEGVTQSLEGPRATANTVGFQEWAALLAGLISHDDVVKGRAKPYVTPVNDFRFAYQGRKYDRKKNQTTFFYKVSGTGGGRDISHVTFEVDNSVSLVSYEPRNKANGGRGPRYGRKWNHDEVEIGRDPASGIKGIKFDVSIPSHGEQSFSLTFAGNVQASVIDVGVKSGKKVEVIKLPGGGDEFVSSAKIVDALELIFFGGNGDSEYLFLTNPLAQLPGESELEAAVRIMTQEVTVVNGLADLEQKLLVAEFIYVLGLGTPDPEFDETIFKFCEPIIQILGGNPPAAASKKKTGMSLMGGTGGSDEAGGMLRSYIRL